MGKKSYVNQDKICTRYIPYSHVALFEVGCKFHSELPSSQSKGKNSVTKLIVPIGFKKKSCSDEAQPSLC